MPGQTSERSPQQERSPEEADRASRQRITASLGCPQFSFSSSKRERGPISFTRDHAHCLPSSCRAGQSLPEFGLQSFSEDLWSLRD